MENYKILVINFGSTSSKFAVYENEKQIVVKTFNYTREELSVGTKMTDQYPLRKKGLEIFLEDNNLSTESFSAIVARGGSTQPLSPGAYLINESMVDVLMNRPFIEHPSNMGPVLALEISKKANIPAYVYDPAFNQMEEVAMITGIPEIRRTYMGHIENMRAVSFKVAEKIGKKIDDCNFIITHLGGGITQSAVKKGRYIDFNDSSNSPFSPERAGIIPARQFAKLIFSGKYTEAEIFKMLTGKGGLYAHLGTTDCIEVEKMISDGNEKAENVYKAMAYQTAKGIGAFAAVLSGEIDAIILTGGIANSKLFIGMVKEKVEFLGPVEILPGEFEMDSLANGTLRVLRGEEQVKEYFES